VANVTAHVPSEHDGETAVDAHVGIAVAAAAIPTAATMVNGVTDQAIRRVTPRIEDSSFAGLCRRSQRPASPLFD